MNHLDQALTETYLHQTERGQLRMSVPAPTVLVFEYAGYSDATFVEFIEDVWNRTFASTSCMVQVFVDTEAQTGYASAFRVRLMQWAKTMMSRTDTYCLLVKSRWVAMGIAIVRSTLGLPAAHAEVIRSRDLFHSKLDMAVRQSIAQNAT